MKKNKLLALAILCLGLCSCGQSEATDNQGGTTPVNNYVQEEISPSQYYEVYNGEKVYPVTEVYYNYEDRTYSFKHYDDKGNFIDDRISEEDTIIVWKGPRKTRFNGDELRVKGKNRTLVLFIRL